MASKKGRRKRTQGNAAPAEPRQKQDSARQMRRRRGIANRDARRREKLLVGAVLLATFFAFVNSLDGEFVYDDRFQVLKNPTITSLSNIPRMMTESVWQFMNQGAAGPVGPYYRPLFNTILIINYQLFGFSVFGWHLVSVLFHLAATLLVYLLGRRYGIGMEGSLVAAGVFGLHPVHSESVAWVSGIPDPMAAVLVLGSILAYERYRETGLGGWRFLGLSAALCFLALLSKETAIALPIFLAFREALDRPETESRTGFIKRVASRTGVFFAAAGAYLLLRYLVLGFIRQDDPAYSGIPFVQVFLTVPSVLVGYVRMLFLPYPLAVVYDKTYVESAADPRFWLSGLALLLIAGITAVFVRKNAIAIRATALMVLFILPVLNLKAFRSVESLLHDRYLYLPSIGFSLLAGLAFAVALKRWGQRAQTVVTAMAVAIMLVLFGLTVNQNTTWQNENAMTGHALELYPQWPFLHNYVGAQHAIAFRWPEAERAYLEAIKYEPRYSDAYSNLGDVYREQAPGRLPEAEQAYLKSIEFGAPYADTRYNLGVTYTTMNRLPDAERALLAALEIEPNHVKARYNLGWIYGRLNRDAEAEQAYAKTLEVDPAYPEPRINLAIIQTKQGRFKEAIDNLLVAKGYAPENLVMLYALGDAYRQSGNYKEAIAVLTQLQTRDPQHKLLYTTLGLCYEAAGNQQQARSNFEKAISVAPNEEWTKQARDRLAKTTAQ